MKPKPVPSSLLDAVEYRDGLLFWKSGKLAGSRNNRGYSRIGWKREYYPAHRVVYALHHGDTNQSIDHIDMNKTNNRIENLRAISNRANLLNRNTGIQWDRLGWKVRAGTKYLGWTKDLFEAWCIRKSFNNKETANG